MNTFKYQKDGRTLHIRGDHGEMRLLMMNDCQRLTLTLDQIGLDALRNYLDDLEEMGDI